MGNLQVNSETMAKLPSIKLIFPYCGASFAFFTYFSRVSFPLRFLYSFLLREWNHASSGVREKEDGVGWQGGWYEGQRESFLEDVSPKYSLLAGGISGFYRRRALARRPHESTRGGGRGR